MDIKISILVFTILVGCLALPTQLVPEDDLSVFFDHGLTNRIVGGFQAEPGSHPHMVALTVGSPVRSFLCGGSLISQWTILTAAHCIDPMLSFGSLVKSLRATVGTNRWDSRTGTSYSISHNVTYPHYMASAAKNDIALLITSTRVVFRFLVQPVPLTYEYIPPGVRARVAGWGSTGADSGSALIRADNGYLFGVVSWGLPCARGEPDIFVRISAYRTWLQYHIV